MASLRIDIPEEIDICGLRWKIVRKRMKDRGMAHLDSRIIDLADRLSGEELEQTYLHELTHVVLHVSGLNSLLNEELEEAICLAMENILYTQLGKAKP